MGSRRPMHLANPLAAAAGSPGTNFRPAVLVRPVDSVPSAKVVSYRQVVVLGRGASEAHRRQQVAPITLLGSDTPEGAKPVPGTRAVGRHVVAIKESTPRVHTRDGACRLASELRAGSRGGDQLGA